MNQSISKLRLCKRSFGVSLNSFPLHATDRSRSVSYLKCEKAARVLHDHSAFMEVKRAKRNVIVVAGARDRVSPLTYSLRSVHQCAAPSARILVDSGGHLGTRGDTFAEAVGSF